MAESVDGRCHLLELPPELRNRIYQDTLFHEAYVDVKNRGYRTPALLSACWKIRGEALPMSYADNKFRFDLSSYSSKAAFQLFQHLPKLKRLPSSSRSNGIPTHEPHWKNLIVWLEPFHKNEVFCLGSPAELSTAVTNDSKGDVIVVAGMFSTTRELRGMRWMDVKNILELQRPVLEHFDRRWLRPDCNRKLRCGRANHQTVGVSPGRLGRCSATRNERLRPISAGLMRAGKRH